jgi:hypothetical protein
MDRFLEVYRGITPYIAAETGASDSLLHVHAGMALLFFVRVETRRSLATWVPVSVVFLAAVLKELIDMWANGYWQTPDSWLDILNTVFWPMALMVGLRWRRAHDLEHVKN